MKICGECKWSERDGWGDPVCVNGESEYCTEYVDPTDSCDGWEAEE